MAKDTLNQKPITLLPAGVNDNSPVVVGQPSLYFTNGVFLGDEQQLQRCNGKELKHKFSAPILAIHGDLRTRVFIETTQALYMFESLDDALPELPLGPPEEP